MAEVNVKQVLIDIVKAIVDNPDEVTVIQTEEENNIYLELNVAPDDMGKVIGRHGRIAKAIRMIVKAAANSIGKKASVEIK
jgi:Predicted RNA-binding protein (contains KH domain)